MYSQVGTALDPAGEVAAGAVVTGGVPSAGGNVDGATELRRVVPLVRGPGTYLLPMKTNKPHCSASPLATTNAAVGLVSPGYEPDRHRHRGQPSRRCGAEGYKVLY
jgi:hypothetical protein